MNKTSILMLASGIFLLDIAMKSLNDDINPNAQSSASKIYIPRDDASRDWLDESVVSWEQIAEHYAPSKGIGDWQKLHSERHWKEGHSAYELASSWENTNPDLPPEIQSLFHGPVKLLAATPEHKTPLRGRGAASQSDVLAFIGIRDRVCALAIEGKVGEGFKKIIKDWSTNASADTKKRLEFLSDTLGIKPVDKLPYQLFHRTAAAVLEARHFKADCAAMIVQSFSPTQKSFDDFAKLINAFGIDSVKPNKLYKTDKAGIDLYLGWADSPNSTLVATIPPAIPAPKESSGILKTYTKYQIEVNSILVLMLIILLLYFMWRTRKDSSSRDEDSDTTSKADEKKETESERKGREFQEYVENLFLDHENIEFFRCANPYGYPDYEATITNKNGEEHKFFVECKWKRRFGFGMWHRVIDDDQLQEYKKHQRKKNGRPFFIMLGVKGTPSKPRYVYIIPLNKLPEIKLSFNQLDDYRQRSTGESTYSPRSQTLKISL